MGVTQFVLLLNISGNQLFYDLIIDVHSGLNDSFYREFNLNICFIVI